MSQSDNNFDEDRTNFLCVNESILQLFRYDEFKFNKFNLLNENRGKIQLFKLWNELAKRGYREKILVKVIGSHY